MSPKEPLRPRYKVIAHWPGMGAEPFHLGQVVTLQRHVIEDGQIWIHIPIKHMPDSYMRQEFFDNFPHLFKKLEWWEDRKPEDMPEYVKYWDTSLYFPVDRVCKGSEAPFTDTWTSDNFRPATEQEYLEYIKQKEG